MLSFIVAGLATWRLCRLLLYETGPFDVFLCLRSAASRLSFTAQLFGCIYCMSMWIGLLCAALMFTEYWVLLVPFALSAMAIVVDSCSRLLSKSLTQG